MSRIATFFTLMLPSMIAGGFIFSSAFTHAASGDPDRAFPPAPVVVAQANPPAPPKRPLPPPPPPPQVTPPPKPGGAPLMSGVRGIVKGQLEHAKAAIRSNPRIPKDMRDKLLARLDKVGATVDKRLANLKLTDLDNLDDEMEKLGEDLEDAMEGLEEDLEKLGEQLGHDLAGDLDFDFDFDLDHDDLPHHPDVADTDDSDLRDAIDDLKKHVALKPAQRDQITKLRADSDKAVAGAKKQIDELSAKLHTALGNPAVTDAEITRLVDQISAQEATIRKARIVAWAQARRVLDAAQRTQIENALKKKTK